MNWTALGAIGQIVGAIAVVASLVYVAAQIRLNTSAIKAETAREVVAAVRSINSQISGDAELNRIFMTWLEDPDALAREEYARGVHVAHNLLRTVEDAHAQYLRGNLERETWVGWDRMFADYLSSPGIQAYWALRSDIYSAPFREYMNSLDASGRPVRPASSSRSTS